jgi:hypothetical protein
MTAVAESLASRQLDLENPWPGLDSFEETASDFFHGREAEGDELVRRVIEAPVAVLFGKSGLGKTSLLKAGLFPRMRQRHLLPVYVRLAVTSTAPALIDQVRYALRDTLAREGVDAPPMRDGESLWEYLHRANLELWDAQNYQQTPVFVFDQFEEVFTLGESLGAAVQSFRVDFGDLAENRIPLSLRDSLDTDDGAASRLDLRTMPYKVVVSLREDFLPDLEGWRRVMPSLGRVRFRLLPMRRDQALAAVYDTAPHLLDQALAAQIVRFVAAEQSTAAEGSAGTLDGPEGEARGSIEPALLSLFCRGLNERRKRQGKARFDSALLDEAQQGIISEYYRSCLKDMPDSVSEFIELELITEKGFRNSFAREDAVPAHLTDDQLDRLIGRRLVRLEERYGAQRIELTHDLLTRAVREHRDARRIEEAGRQREAQLEQAQLLERQARLELEAAAGRRFKRLAFALTVLLAVAALMAILTVQQSLRANREARMASEQSRRANREALVASEQRARAEQALKHITDGVRMKQAVLSGNRRQIDAFLQGDLANHSIRFMGRAENLGYKSNGRSIFKFLLFPDRSTLPGGDSAVAVVTYRMDHPTFQNALLTTGRDHDFTASYQGWGCLQRVIVLIEYVNPERSPEIADYNMCAAFGW